MSDDGFLSPSEAVERLMAKGAPAPVEAAPVAEPAPTPEPVEKDADSEVNPQTSETSSEPLQANAPDEVAEQPEPETAIEPPHWWSADKKARFAELPSDLQAVVVEQEKNREAGTTKAQQKAAEAAKQAEQATTAAQAKMAETTQLLVKVNTVLPQAEAWLESRWAKVDWVKWAQDDPAAYVAGKAQYDIETQQLQQLKSAKDEAESRVAKEQSEAAAAQRQEWAKTESSKLLALVPDLADPAKSKALTEDIRAYARNLGATDEQINSAGAIQWAMAYRAMVADKASKALVEPKPKTPPAPARPAVRPSGAQTTTRTTTADTAKARLAQTGRPDDAVALLLARAQKG